MILGKKAQVKMALHGSNGTNRKVGKNGILALNPPKLKPPSQNLKPQFKP